MIIVYRIEEAPDGRWLLFRGFGDTWPTCPVRRSGSTVRPARFPTRRMVLDAFENQRRVDRGAATRLGLDVEVRLLPYP